MGELHSVLPALALLRETLENGGGVEQSPWDALNGDKAEPFAAGSAWALSTVIGAVLEERERHERATEARASREDVRLTVLRLLGEQTQVSSREIVEHAGLARSAVSKTTVSKAVGDLLDEGTIVQVPSPAGTDRRHRWYRVAEAERPRE